MAGRYLKGFSAIWRPIYFDFEDGSRFSLGEIQILCPQCSASEIRTCGTHLRKGTRVEYFRCYNKRCISFKNRGGRQFCLTSSLRFHEMIGLKLQSLSHRLMDEGVKYSALAQQYHFSVSQVCSLRCAIQKAISNSIKTHDLVDVPQPDRAIAIDETFLKIDGKTFYVILATGYTTHKCLGLKVSETRNEGDLLEVFNEADRNTIGGITAVTADALNATQAMVKNLGREITLIIHKHKTPYDRVVVRHFTYANNNRITGEIGIKTDVFLHRKKREFHWREITESIVPKTHKKKGRPRGKWKRRPKIKKKRLKRGRKGLFTVFDTGKRAYLKADPGRLTLQIGTTVPQTVSTGMHVTFGLFAGMSIQNNLSEHINSLIKALVGLSGPKHANSISEKIRITIRVWNQPSLLETLRVERNFHGKNFLKSLDILDFKRLSEIGWNLRNMEKKSNGGNFSFV